MVRLFYRLMLILVLQTAVYATTTIQNSYSFDELNKLTASDAAVNDNFGFSVAISGDYAVVGAYGNSDDGTASGSAYIFKNDGSGNFTQNSKLTASDAAGVDYFGRSVAISGDYAVVGAYGDDDNGADSGSAYIFKNDGSGNFIESSKLIASDGAAGEYFGISVSISGNYAVVGAYRDDDNGTNSGSAYIFKNDGSGNFTQSRKLTASDAAALNYFGYSVAISGDYAVVGAYGNSDDGTASGSAYIFKNDGDGNFIQSSKITASDAATGDNFGYSVAISGDFAVVGAHQDDDNGYKSGSAYIFKNDGSGNFTQSSKLRASDGVADDWFGYSVAISGDHAVVGAYQDDDNGTSSGSAYIFRNDENGNFVQSSKIAASDTAENDRFGGSVAMSGDHVIVGARYNGGSSGSSYIFNAGINTATPENTTRFSLDIDATETIDYAISGVDSAIFNIDPATGEITFKTAPDYENPADADSNNIYEISVTANGTINSDVKSVKISVIDSTIPVIQNSYSFDELNKLRATDGEISDHFGYSVAISGDYAVVGATGDDDNGADSGSAYIFKNDGNGTFTQSSKLRASDGATFDNFGYSVAISDDFAVVGSPYSVGNGSYSGSAYIFKNDGSGNFIESSKLIASDAAAGDRFGGSVAIIGDYAVVGAYVDDDHGTDSGSAYIFKNDGSGNFIQSDKLTASDAAASDNFGWSVAISGDFAVVGAYGDDDHGSSSGSAYIFKNDGNGTFTQSSKLIASDGATFDNFGYSVAISGDFALVGAHQDTDNGYKSGSAYIFTNDGSGNFIQSSKLTASDGAVNDFFGWYVAISGNYAVVGAYGDDDNGSSSGSAYIFKNDGSGNFIQSDKLTASDAAASNNFGWSVAISGDFAVVGAYGDDDHGIDSGSATIFNGAIKTDTLENSTTFSLDITAIETIDYSISGIDSALFNINTATGEIIFKTAPDYEIPTDTDTNNIYEISVTANGGGTTITRAIKITVTDKEDETAPTGYNVELNASEITQSNSSFTITLAEIGSTYSYTISSSRGGSVTGSGTIITSTQIIEIADLSGLMDGDITLTVTLTDTAGNTSTAETDLSLLNLVIEGITITMLDSNSSESVTNNTATFNVRLMSQPVYAVDVALSSNDTTEGVIINEPASLNFSTADWDTNQLVTVTGVDDTEVDGDILYRIDLNTTSGDSLYDGKSESVSLMNRDDDKGMNPAIIMYLLN